MPISLKCIEDDLKYVKHKQITHKNEKKDTQLHHNLLQEFIKMYVYEVKTAFFMQNSTFHDNIFLLVSG